MDFFRSQRDARRQTLILLALFFLVVTLVAALTSAVVWWGCSSMSPQERLFCTRATALIIITIIIGAAIVRFLELRDDGGATIAYHLGGEPLPISHSDNPLHQRFRNIAEEMALASRTPIPMLYWLPHENSINAFVAGFTPADAVLAVTRGALERLNRDELQGVVAHEFSHLLNGDMRLNTQISSWIFGIYAVYISGCRILRLRPSNDLRGWLLIYLFGITLMVIGFFGKLGGRLLQAAISRQREYLADASAVQFTRQKMGLAGALKKIYADSSLLYTPQAETYNHFFLGEAVKVSSLFATHPPLVERIRTLDRSFNPRFIRRATPETRLDVDAPRQAPPLYFAAGAGASVSEHETASSMRDGLALLFANLLDADDENVRRRQLEAIETDWSNDIADQARLLEPEVHAQKTYLRLTRVRLMLVQLHTLSVAQQKTLSRTLRTLIAADDNISLLEIAIVHLVDQYLRDMAQPGRVRVAGPLRLSEWATDTALLQELVTNHKKEIPAQVALDSIGSTGKTTTTNTRAVRQALDRLNRLTLDEKKNLLQTLYDACGTPSPTQQEILSLLAVCLHAPPLEAMLCTEA
ncbi:MAG: M48 family metalloprotease [Proteobacteria bacterium]|nr:M48 family metalloprotease [Pseudomonadota bacterium]MCL2307750.1 M48 family metalloprotease [Pseudomonadota bacterium]